MPTRRETIALAGFLTAGAVALGVGSLKQTDSDSGPKTRVDPDSAGYDLPSDYINVQEYGAKGDGETDDSGAITEAIRAAEPGETVFLPETDHSYLLSYNGGRNVEYSEKAIQLDSSETTLEGITVEGETAAEGAQTLQVEPQSYDPELENTMLRIDAEEIIKNLTFRNITFDGARPEDDGAAGLDGEASLTGILLRRGDANGGHSILFEDCIVRNCSSTGIRIEESGVICRRVTSRGNGRHGFNPVAKDTTVDPGFVGKSIKAIDCDGTGIDHRRGTARLTDVYTENNRSGNKWKHLVERLEVVNHHSVNDQNHGWRSNHTASHDDEQTPEEQVISLNKVFVENCKKTGIRVSGTDADTVFDLGGIEVRGISLESPDTGAGVRILRDVEIPDTGESNLVVVETKNGPGIRVFDTTVKIDTYHHKDNALGRFEPSLDGQLIVRRFKQTDPGRNVFDTPGKNDVGAFTTSHKFARYLRTVPDLTNSRLD